MQNETNVVPFMPSVAKADFETRSAVQAALAAAVGLREPETRLPPGTALLAVGEENKRALQGDIAKLPDLHVGVGQLVNRVQAEQHKDFEVNIFDVRMDPLSGRLYGKNGARERALAYTVPGFSQVAQYIKPASVNNGFTSNMLALPNDLRSQVFDYHAGNARPKRGDTSHFIRTLVHGGSGQRLIRAVTSDRHSLSTGDDLTIASVLANMPKGGKLRVTRTMDRSDFEIIWPAMDRQLVVGDIALIALTITNSETKGTSLRIEPKLLRVLCYNFTTAYTEGGEEEISLKHIGDLGRKLPAAIKRAQEVVEPFIHAFSDAYANELPRSRAEVLEALGKRKMLGEGVLGRAAALWDADGERTAGDTLAGLVNALTRASQEQTMALAAETERIAGKLVVGGWGSVL